MFFFYWPIYQRLSAGHSCSSWSLWMGIGEDGVDVKGLRGPKSVGIIWTEAWNHGFYREITTKWPQDSGWWNIIIYPVIYGIMMNCPQWQLYIHGIIRGSWPVVLSVIEGNSQRNFSPRIWWWKIYKTPLHLLNGNPALVSSVDFLPTSHQFIELPAPCPTASTGRCTVSSHTWPPC